MSLCYRQGVEELVDWCRANNLCINVGKTKEMVERPHPPSPPPLFIRGATVEMVSTCKYLGLHISNDLTWANNTASIIKKAHQHLYFLRRLKWAGLSTAVLTSFYCCVVERILRPSPHNNQQHYHEGPHPPGTQTVHPLPSGEGVNSLKASQPQSHNNEAKVQLLPRGGEVYELSGLKSVHCMF
ncbi:hypothetical protein N1851_001785 [Merluccius polli]|uniref:Alkylated DNA repair protein AlkB homologue 8 N-terminal domain-containing protein n=1 Tax=Merluccius polli TaxID=89951 RepID=A0AA47PBE8_MERPO|nr:hypothetical protein N1851_001785 [Merluccius polli]